jgi:hypothetical protein
MGRKIEGKHDRSLTASAQCNSKVYSPEEYPEMYANDPS